MTERDMRDVRYANKPKPRTCLHHPYREDLITVISKIETMRTQIGYHIVKLNEDDSEYLSVITTPLMKSLYEDLLYVEDIIENEVARAIARANREDETE